MPIPNLATFTIIGAVLMTSCTALSVPSTSQLYGAPNKSTKATILPAPEMAPNVQETRYIRAASAEMKTAPKLDNDPRPFDETRNAKSDVDATLFAARSRGKNAMIVMGANWCHDSRALAGHFEKPKFQSLINAEYELVYVDVGQKDRNIETAERFGLETVEGTPTVFIVSPKGKVLNLDSAPTWRNAASMEEDDIHRYFTDFAKAAKDAR